MTSDHAFPALDIEFELDGETIRGQVLAMGDGNVTARLPNGKEITFFNIELLAESIKYPELQTAITQQGTMTYTRSANKEGHRDVGESDEQKDSQE